MKKLRLTATAVLEYSPDAVQSEMADINTIAELDQEVAADDPFAAFNHEGTLWENVRVEVIDC